MHSERTLILLSALAITSCGALPEQSSEASSERVYRTGSNIPVHERTPYHFKRHAIQNCLYGVDIDSGAVEIAKLRLWLSLVVDEEEVTLIKPLPNLDFKIVTGNSLLSVDKDELENWQAFRRLEEIKPKFFDEPHGSAPTTR